MSLDRNVLQFQSLSGISFDDLSFLKINTDAVGPIVSEYSDFFKREKYDVPIFKSYLCELLQVHQLALGTLVVVNQHQGEQINCLGFLYQDDRQIIPIQFESSANFDAWFKELGKGFRRNQIIHKITATGFSSAPAISSDFNVYEQTEAFLQKHAPQEYYRDRIQAEKQAFLDFQVLESMRQTVNPNETLALWQEYLSLNSSAQISSTAITDFSVFETITGIPFPTELQAIYRQTNGAVNAFFRFELMPFATIIKEWQSWKQGFDDWTLEELMSIDLDGGRTRGMYNNPYWIPFIDMVSGNYLAVDLMPGKKGKIGQIISFGADQETSKYVASNLNELLSSSIEILKNPSKENHLKQHFYL